MDRRHFVTTVGLGGFAFLAGCDRSKKAVTKNAIPSANAEVLRLSRQDVERLIAAKRRYRIGILFPFQGIPFWTNEAFGIFDQASRSGVDLIWRSADGYENVDRQVAQISEMKSLGVDAVLLGATSFSGTRAAVEDLVSSGIPVVNHVTSTDSPVVSSKVLVDYREIGRKQAAFLKAAQPTGGELLMLNGPAGAEWSMNEVSGFKEEIGSGGPWKIVAERNSNPDRVAAQRFMEDLVVRFPAVTAVFSVTDSLAMGAVDALTGANKVGRVFVTTAGFSPETVDRMRAGAIHINVDESPVLIGRAALNAVVAILNGNSIAGTQYVPTPEHTRSSLAALNLQAQWAPNGWSLP